MPCSPNPKYLQGLGVCEKKIKLFVNLFILELWHGAQRSGAHRNYGNVTSNRSDGKKQPSCSTCIILNVHLVSSPKKKKPLGRRGASASLLVSRSSWPGWGQASDLENGLECHWYHTNWPGWLLLHSVLDGPPLTGAGLQDQQVAEVNVSRHHL